MARHQQYTLRLLWFYLGMVVMSIGYGLIIKPGLGASAWDIFHIGLHNRTGMSLSIVVQMTGLAVIGVNWLIGLRPTIGMVLNMLSLGPLLQWTLDLLPEVAGPLGRWGMLLVGILVAGLGMALYVSAGIGSGPRDGMVLGLCRRLRLPVGVVKNACDLAVALIGWWLGGPLGVGSLVVALGLGPAFQLSISLVSRLSSYSPFKSFVTPVVTQRG